ncbi:MAG: sulfite exporter TauE/SafE family protein [Gammaproteobacteria bacterium]|nr:sulfite exporter TauE/SafE family protein [Gammaproteobacteria bacterium]
MIDAQLIIVLFLIVGLITGMFSALFGIGGGVIIVPLLYRYFSNLDLPDRLQMHVAVATSLLTMLLITSNSIYWHYKKGDILIPELKKMLPWVAVGAFVGSMLGSRIGVIVLHDLLVTVLLGAIILKVLKIDFFKNYSMHDFIHPTFTHNAVVCSLVGFISVLIGVGGSIMTVPYLRNAKMPMLNATSLSVSLVPAVSLFGTLGYMFAIKSTIALPSSCWGYVYMPAFICISLGAVLGAPIGIRLAHVLSDRVIASSYVVLLLVLLVSAIY